MGVGTIVRRFFASATVVFALVGFVIRDDPRWFAASGACGLLWWSWELLHDHVFAPLGEWLVRAFSGGLGEGPPVNTRPTLEDTIRLLESHIAANASQGVQINAAIRLEEIYRAVKRDPAKARDVIRRVRERFPDAPALSQYLDDGAVDDGRSAAQP